MERRLISYADVAHEALRRSGRDASSVDMQAMRNGIVAAAEYQLQQYCEKIDGLRWGPMKAVLDRPDFTPQMLTDHLSTCGVGGAAAIDLFAEVLQEVIPDLVAKQIREGALDAIGPAAAPEQVASGFVRPNPRFVDAMPYLIPTAEDVVRLAALQAGSNPSTLDMGRLTAAVDSAVETQLQDYCSQLPSVGWPAVKTVLDRPDVSPQLLRDYLSTRGNEGVAVYNALRGFLTEQLPPTIVEIIREAPTGNAPAPAATVFPKSASSGFPSSSAPRVQATSSFSGGSATVTRPAAPTRGPHPAAKPSRNLLYIGGASALAALLIAVAIGLNAGGSDGDRRPAKPEATDIMTDAADSGGSGQWGSSGGGPTSSGPQRSPNDLNISVPMSHPPCDGSGIVVLANAVTPGRYESEIQRYLGMYPGSSYLRTDESCSSLRRRDDAGNPIYAVYRPAGRGEAQVCAAVRAAGGSAYGKWLDNTTDPRHMIQC